MSDEATVLEAERATTLARGGAAGLRVARTTIIESFEDGPPPPFCGPVPGGQFLEYRVVEPMKVASGEADFFLLEQPGLPSRRVLKLYRYGVRPKMEILGLISGLASDHVVKVFHHGGTGDRHYEIQEYLPHGSLADLLRREGKVEESRARLLIGQIAEALNYLQTFSVLHRDVKPSNILVRTLEPPCLVLSDFGISSVSDLSLHLTTVSRTPAYCAPEATTGVVTKASDWWSLGVIALEMLTGAHPYAGMSEQAINFQLVSRGIAVPESLPANWVPLLRGLLTRNYQHRWGGGQVRRWLAGDFDIPVVADEAPIRPAGPVHQPYRFLDAACAGPAELAQQLARSWPEASKHWAMGYVLRWVESEVKEQQMAGVLREIQSDPLLASDHKLGAALLAMHPDLPLVVQGNVLDEAAGASHPELAAALAHGSLGQWLRRLRRDDWLARWTEQYRMTEQAVMKLDLRDNPEEILEPELAGVSERISAEVAARMRALLCAPIDSLRMAAEKRRALFAGGRTAALDATFAHPAPGRVEWIHLLLAPVSQFFTESEVAVERGLKSVRAFGWALDESMARRLWAAPEWPRLAPLWQKIRDQAEERKRTPLAFSHPNIGIILEHTNPAIEAAIAVLANRLDFQNSLGIRFVPAPGARAFWSVWQTRVSDFDEFAKAEGRQRKVTASFVQTPDHPAVFVSWEEASAFCQWLTTRERELKRIGPRDVYRLPSDVEWSRMAGLKGEPGATPRERNGAVKGIFPWGTAWPPPGKTGNLGAALGIDAFPFTAPVGRFAPNEWGLHDLGSNVMEWCADSYDVDLDLKVVRGASWYHATPENCWTSVRRRLNGNESSDTLGFRCVLDYKVPPPASFAPQETAAAPVENEPRLADPPVPPTPPPKAAPGKTRPFWKIL